MPLTTPYAAHAATRLVIAQDATVTGVKVTLGKPPAHAPSAHHQLRTVNAEGREYARVPLGMSGLVQHDQTVVLSGGRDARVLLERLEDGAVVDSVMIPVVGRTTDASYPLLLPRR